jgi:outer membrane lipoprotein-sorting protein
MAYGMRYPKPSRCWHASHNPGVFPTIVAFAAALSGCGGSTVPRTDDSAADAAAAAAQAEGVSEKMLAVYRGAKSYADHAAYVEQAVYRGEGVEHELPFYQMSLALERPNKLRLTFEEAIQSRQGRQRLDVACDGVAYRAVTTAAAGQTLSKSAPASLNSQNALADPVLSATFGGRGLGEVFPQLAMLLYRDDELIFPQDDNPRLLDDAPLRGRMCHRLATSHPEGTRVLWIDRETYLLHRMEIPAESHRRAYGAEQDFLKLAVWIDFLEPTLNAGIVADSFQFEAPKDNRIVDALTADAGEPADDAADDRASADSQDRQETGGDDEEPSAKPSPQSRTSPPTAPK